MSNISDINIQSVFHDLITNLTYGSIKDPNNLYIQLSKNLILQKNIQYNALLLEMIYVPPSQRHHGIATTILNYLEEYVDSSNLLLVVGPIMEDIDGNAYMGNLCKKRNYQSFPPFMYLRNVSKTF